MRTFVPGDKIVEIGDVKWAMAGSGRVHCLFNVDAIQPVLYEHRWVDGPSRAEVANLIVGASVVKMVPLTMYGWVDGRAAFMRSDGAATMIHREYATMVVGCDLIQSSADPLGVVVAVAPWLSDQRVAYMMPINVDGTEE